MPLTGYFCQLENDLFSPMTTQQHIDINDLGVELEERTIVANVADPAIARMEENINVAGSMNVIAQRLQQRAKTVANGCSGIH